jgi:hypothetical protein
MSKSVAYVAMAKEMQQLVAVHVRAAFRIIPTSLHFLTLAVMLY